ncbi:hypothetical protein EB796_008963 [Bugula neritina]|uniref:Uncharacterized protein n=1 Tax=Bugula neritina TaxID=10212 RepID=A0A7J7K3H4_BUGNE|nr:hypothetical protein EB796_008963 [Bugula neritina]
MSACGKAFKRRHHLAEHIIGEYMPEKNPFSARGVVKNSLTPVHIVNIGIAETNVAKLKICCPYFQCKLIKIASAEIYMAFKAIKIYFIEFPITIKTKFEYSRQYNY